MRDRVAQINEALGSDAQRKGPFSVMIASYGPSCYSATRGDKAVSPLSKMRHASKRCPYTEGTRPFRGGCIMDGTSIENLTKLLKTPIRPIIIDVRRDDAYAAASGVKSVWDKIAEIRAANPTPAKTFGGPDIAAENAITPAPLEAILGVKGQASQGLFKVVIAKPASMQGTSIGKEMGVNTWAAFGGRDKEAVIDGDFAMTETELQTVLKTMRRDGINIVAIHHHMTGEEPRILFLHYWAKGDASKLALAFKHALDAQAEVVKHASMAQ